MAIKDMLGLDIVLDGDNAWPELRESGWTEGTLDAVCCLARGMQSGAPSVTVRVTLPDGKTVLAQTSLKLFLAAADAFKARHGDPRHAPRAGGN